MRRQWCAGSDPQTYHDVDDFGLVSPIASIEMYRNVRPLLILRSPFSWLFTIGMNCLYVTI